MNLEQLERLIDQINQLTDKIDKLERRIADIELNKSIEINYPLYLGSADTCPKCGLDFTVTQSYCCPRNDCPSQMRVTC